MARGQRYQAQYSEARDSSQEETGDTTTYYLVPPSNQFPQAVPQKRPQPSRQPRQNLVETRKNPLDAFDEAQFIQSLPGLAKRRGLGMFISFAFFVILPTVLAFIYYSSIATPQYVSEFRFSVKDTSATTNTSSPGLLSMIGGGPTGSVIENYLVVDYLTSRQAVDDLQKQVPLIDLYSRPDIDSWSRFDRSSPVEEFVLYWRKMIRSHYDQVTGIATAQIRAFTPQDSLSIANALVSLSEELVNKIASRTRNDAVKFAEGEVEKAQERVRKVRAQLIERTSTSGSVASPQAGANAALLLDLERQTAQNMLASSMQTLDQARANAVTQHLYITPYVRPSLPQSSVYPRTYLSTFIAGALAFMFWVIGLLTVRAIFER